MTVRIEVTPTRQEDGWRFMLRCPEAQWWASHWVEAFSAGPRYPKPQLPCQPGCDHRLCRDSTAGDVDRALSSLARREYSGEKVGRYLYDIVLSRHWQQITDFAGQLGHDVVELALTWPYLDDGEGDSSRGWAALSQLPWELMRDERGHYLATAGGKVSVAVTRVVADTYQQARDFSVPPRVLFVVGTALADRSVRAGAEMLALLREVREAGCRVRHRILENATPRRLTDVMSAFRPDIVHFISHGMLAEDGRGKIQLKSDHEDEEPWWAADKLIQHLTVGGQLPPVVVLSACEAGGRAIVGSRLAAPLAAELVHGGVPVVVAMAGTVSDRACRVFTRHFGRALAAGDSLVVATARARQLAFAETPGGADWALPAVFFSAAVDAGALRCSPDAGAKHLDDLVDEARWNQVPVFCARESFLQTFWAMLGNAGWEELPGRRPSVLAICADAAQSGLGKTRLLEELAREALLGGHLPLVVSSSRDNAPRDVRRLAQNLALAIRKLGAVLKIEDDLGGGLTKLARQDRTDPLGTDGELSPGEEVPELAEQLEQDAEQLRQAAADTYSVFNEDSRVVLLIDNLGEASDELLKKLFDRENGLDRNGLGSSARPVPVVLVVLTDDKPGIRRDLRTGRKSESWLVSQQLLAFDQGGEDMLAYELVLLHPFHSALDNTQLQHPWIFNRADGRQERNEKHARITLEGKPAYFKEDRFELFVKLGIEHEVLTTADDGIPVSAVR